MPTIQVEAHLSTQELFVAIEQLSLSELESILDKANILRASRIASILSQSETTLLQKINQPLPETIMLRFAALRKQQENEPLTPEAEAELVDLINQIETAEAERIQNLAELAQLRGQSLVELMDELEIKPRTDA